jgi:hypothetical protein
MRFLRKRSVAMAAVSLLGSTAVKASPLLILSVLGNTDGSANYSTHVTASQGQTIFYEVMATIAPSGTTNANGYHLIGQVPGTDGVNALGIQLTDTTANAVLSLPTLSSGFTSGFGTTAGTINGQAVTGIYAAQAGGTFVGATSPVQVLTGSFKAGSTADTFAATFDPDPNANGVGFFVNDATLGHASVQVFDNTAAANNNDPEINDSTTSGFSPLTVSVPEPASLSALGLGALTLLRRRKRVGKAAIPSNPPSRKA